MPKTCTIQQLYKQGVITISDHVMYFLFY